MSQGTLEYLGFQFNQRVNEEQPAFRKKDGGVWFLNPGSVDFSQFQPGKLYIEWDNWTVQKASKEIPQKRGGSWKAQPYHWETFVSNVVGQAIQAGLIKEPGDLAGWATLAATIIRGLQGGGQQQAKPPSPMSGGQATGSATSQSSGGGADFDDKIPF